MWTTTGCGNGPFKMTLSIYRRGEIAVFDWTGTDPQAEGPINFHIHEGLCKLFFGVYMIMAFDPSVLFNEGFYDLFEIVLPEGCCSIRAFRRRCRTGSTPIPVSSIARPARSASARRICRWRPATAPARTSSSPGTTKDNKYFQLMELLFGGVPGRPRGDGLDGHAWWPLFSATPIEYIENYYPVLVESYRPIKDSGGAGLHRGGAGIEKVYHMLEAGKVSIHDDREVVPPWGINGGQFGGTSSKWVIKAGSETRERIPSKIDNLAVKAGDRIVFKTAGSGGWGDPLDRDAEKVARDVRYDLVSAEKAESDYGVRADQRPRRGRRGHQKTPQGDARRARRARAVQFRLSAAGPRSGGIAASAFEGATTSQVRVLDRTLLMAALAMRP